MSQQVRINGGSRSGAPGGLHSVHMRQAMLRKQCLTCAQSLAPRYDRMPLMLHQSMLIEWRGRAIDTTMRTKQSMPCAMLYISCHPEHCPRIATIGAGNTDVSATDLSFCCNYCTCLLQSASVLSNCGASEGWDWDRAIDRDRTTFKSGLEPALHLLFAALG